MTNKLNDNQIFNILSEESLKDSKVTPKSDTVAANEETKPTNEERKPTNEERKPTNEEPKLTSFFLSNVETNGYTPLMPTVENEVLTQESEQETTSIDILKGLLKPANDILLRIQQYCIDNSVPQTKIKPTSQFFFYENTYFILEDLQHLNAIESLTTNLQAIELNINKVNLFKNLESFFIVNNIFQDCPMADILKAIPSKAIAKIVSNVFTFDALDNLDSEVTTLRFSFNRIANKIGYCIMQYYIHDFLEAQNINFKTKPGKEKAIALYQTLSSFKIQESTIDTTSQTLYETLYNLKVSTRRRDGAFLLQDKHLIEGLVNFTLHTIIQENCFSKLYTLDNLI